MWIEMFMNALHILHSVYQKVSFLSIEWYLLSTFIVFWNNQIAAMEQELKNIEDQHLALEDTSKEV